MATRIHVQNIARIAAKAHRYENSAMRFATVSLEIFDEPDSAEEAFELTLFTPDPALAERLADAINGALAEPESKPLLDAAE